MKQPAETGIPGWDQVAAYLEEWLGGCTSLTIIGIGNDLRGDDGAGPRFIRLLKEQAAGREGLILIDAATVPENHIGVVVDTAPSHLLLVDAAYQEGDRPGLVRMVAENEIGNASSSTHTLSLSLVIGLIKQQITVEIALLGIQPAAVGFFEEELSPEIERTVMALAGWFAEFRPSARG